MDRLKGKALIIITAFLSDLHSSMDRLKVKYIDNSVSVKKDLHSSIDRLKGESCQTARPLNCIYIPVWID